MLNTNISFFKRKSTLTQILNSIYAEKQFGSWDQLIKSCEKSFADATWFDISNSYNLSVA